jgi:hypothetical protein
MHSLYVLLLMKILLWYVVLLLKILLWYVVLLLKILLWLWDDEEQFGSCFV